MIWSFVGMSFIGCSEYDIKSTVAPNEEVEEMVETLEEERVFLPQSLSAK